MTSRGLVSAVVFLRRLLVTDRLGARLGAETLTFLHSGDVTISIARSGASLRLYRNDGLDLLTLIINRQY